MRFIRQAWILGLGLTACFRSDMDMGISVRVVHEIRTVNVDESETVSRVPGAAAVVALAPADTDKRKLDEIDSGWLQRTADAEGVAEFEAADEIVHVLVDLDDDGLVDARVLRVVPGRTVTVVVTGTAAGEGEWLKAETDEPRYAPGDKVQVSLEGYVAGETDVTLEVWNEGDKRRKLATLRAGTFAGDVSKTTSFTIGADWPISSAQRLDDYLVVPHAHDRYYEGARFSVRKATVPANMSALGLTINGGVTTTTVRTVTLAPTAVGAARVAFSENTADFPAGVTKLLFKAGDTYPFLLSSGDGRKTVWAMFFDADDNYAAPVSASIKLDTAVYPTPITGIVFTINYGAAVTLSPAVRLQASAYGAQTVAFADDPMTFLYSPLKFQAGLANYGYMLPGTNGTKTVWAQFYDANGFYSAPVSASILLEEGYPSPPDASKLYVITHKPGTADELGGYAGAVGPFDPVVIYVDRYETRVLAQGTANADGSFGPWSILDGSAGNVEEPADLVYVVRTDTFGRESVATSIRNDSTPPHVYQEHLTGKWYVDTKGQGVGNKGDVFQAQINIDPSYGPAQEIVGGIVNFGGMGGPTFVVAGPFTASMYAAYFTVPTSSHLDSDFLRYRARVSDAAGNMSGWITSYYSYSIDTIAPSAVDVIDWGGGNREFWETWDDPNQDASGGYIASFVDETGASFEVPIDLWTYCAATNYSGNSCVFGAILIGGGVVPPGLGGGSAEPYTFENIPNCHWYTVRIQAVDNGGNVGAYSVPVSDRVILPPPDFQAWGSFSQGGTGTLTYSMNSVTNASDYELHFDLDSGAPYAYTTSTGKVSPMAVTITAEPYVQRLSGFPMRTKVYMSSRAIDGTCKSDYAPEMTAATDLRLEATSDGNPGETIGGALAAVNDLDFDGYPDFLVGATLGDFVVAASGGAGAARMLTFGDYVASEAYDLPGHPIAAADIDGDGKDEYLVGSPVDSFGGKQLAGAVRVYDDNFVLLATLGLPVEGLHLGFAVANIGDRNGDGKEDFVAGGFGCAHRDCGYDIYTGTAAEGPGKVVVFDGATLAPIATVPGPQAGDYFGAAVAGGSDVNGDGIGDVAVGAPGSPSMGSQGVGIFDGATGDTIVLVPPQSWRFGSALAFIPDIDGDGKDDLIVGSPSDDAYGAVFAVSSADGHTIWQQDGSMTLNAHEFGGVVATGGDINGDGQPDVVVGAPPRIQNYYYGTGAAFVLDGKTGRFLYELTGSAVDGAIGYAVLSPGNLNAGSRDEWVVGAPGTSQGGSQAGRVYILTTDP